MRLCEIEKFIFIENFYLLEISLRSNFFCRNNFLVKKFVVKYFLIWLKLFLLLNLLVKNLFSPRKSRVLLVRVLLCVYESEGVWVFIMYSCVCICRFLACISVILCFYEWMFVWMFMCVCVCMFVCMYVRLSKIAYVWLLESVCPCLFACVYLSIYVRMFICD